MNLELYDHLGNSYERKNLYLKQCIIYQNLIDTEVNVDKQKKYINKLNELKANKDNHQYNLKYKNYLAKEQDFFKALKAEMKLCQQYMGERPSKAQKLHLKLYAAQQKLMFYEPYIELCYDAEVKYKTAKVILDHYPSAISYLEVNEALLHATVQSLKNLDRDFDQEVQLEFRILKEHSKALLTNEIAKLKQDMRHGVITAKEFEKIRKELIVKFKTDIEVIQSEMIPSINHKEQIRSKKYGVTKATKDNFTAIKISEAHAIKTTPIETTRNLTYYPYITFLLPGLGQALNQQYIKALLYFISTLFIYLIAVPYSLGYGNYQAHGLSSLIALGADGPKIHLSIVYLIEGVISLALVILALIIMFISFIDVRKVSIAKMRGLRPNTWFETRRIILEEGFPYLAILPALIAIVFLVIVPSTTTFLLSFTNMNPYNQTKFEWYGLTNYLGLAQADGMIGTVFWSILGWTIVWTIASTTISIGIGFALALLTNHSAIKGKAFYRTVFILPWAIPAFVLIMLLSIMYGKEGWFTGLNLDIKNNTFLTRFILIAIQSWLGSAYVFLLSTNVLQAIPADFYEAAQLDGASVWQKLSKITLPIILFQTAPLLIAQYTFNFNNFSIIYLFNEGGPLNPVKYGNLAGSSDILISYVYKLMILNQQEAVGAAITVIITIGLTVFAFIAFKRSKTFRKNM